MPPRLDLAVSLLPPSLAAALFRHAAARPEEPWVFRPEGLDWRWHPFGEMARRVALDAARFPEIPSGSLVEIPFRADPAWLSLDLGVQASGRVAGRSVWPDATPAAPTPGEEEGGGPVSPWPDPPRAPGERATRRTWRDLPLPPPGFPAEAPASRGGVALRPAGEPAGAGATVWSAGDLVAAGAALGAALETAAGPPAGGREIVVWSGPPDDPGTRAFLAWAALGGAALVLEPDPRSLAATAAWVRPTFFQGSPADLAALRQWVGELSPRRWWHRPSRLPLGRLRAVRPLGPEELPAEEGAFWRERGVAILAAGV